MADFLTANSFSHKVNQKIFNACKDLAENHQPIDIRTVSKYLDHAPSKKLIANGENGQYHYSEINWMLHCTSKVNSAANVAYHCMQLVELNIRSKMFMETMKIEENIPTKAKKDFRQFQENICLLNGYNDLFKLLEAAKNYFRIHAPQLADSIENMLQLIDRKAEIINQKHGEQMILKTLEHYREKAHA